uniref:Uncharacterized protein n=1 Tax=Anopheles coluzzii TaxID=1518534 RepID=A0A8W7PQL7_ANOCL
MAPRRSLIWMFGSSIQPPTSVWPRVTACSSSAVADGAPSKIMLSAVRPQVGPFCSIGSTFWTRSSRGGAYWQTRFRKQAFCISGYWVAQAHSPDESMAGWFADLLMRLLLLLSTSRFSSERGVLAGGGGGGATPPPDTGGGAGGGVGGGDGVLFDMVLATRSGEEVDRAKWSCFGRGRWPVVPNSWCTVGSNGSCSAQFPPVGWMQASEQAGGRSPQSPQDFPSKLEFCSTRDISQCESSFCIVYGHWPRLSGSV